MENKARVNPKIMSSLLITLPFLIILLDVIPGVPTRLFGDSLTPGTVYLFALAFCAAQYSCNVRLSGGIKQLNQKILAIEADHSRK